MKKFLANLQQLKIQIKSHQQGKLYEKLIVKSIKTFKNGKKG